ncbi:GMC oxidoreductase [Variovorax sp. LjRoot178]|uniref:GMC oxidoreductase n=1 Tax=Variovorax sp. LjRoot178 TaxID=3342277 RepID=UPI003ECF0FFE
MPRPSVQDDDEILAFMPAHGNSATHPDGTCRMNGTAVVDERLRARGMERLAGGGCIDHAARVSGNTNAPAP